MKSAKSLNIRTETSVMSTCMYEYHHHDHGNSGKEYVHDYLYLQFGTLMLLKQNMNVIGEY